MFSVCGNVTYLVTNKKLSLGYGYLAVQSVKNERSIDAEECLLELMMTYWNEQFSDTCPYR